MQAPGQDLLAGAGFAQQQDGGVAGRDLLDGAADLEHFRIIGDQALQGFGTIAGAQGPVFLFQAIDPEGAIDDQLEYLFLEGLVVEVEGAQADGLDGVGPVLIAGDDDDLGGGAELQDLLQGRETFRGAMLSIPKGQAEAAWAFGMGRTQTFIRITAPQMVRYALPGFTNNWLVLIKATALVSLIGLQEMTYLAKQASAATRSPFAFFLFTGALFLLYTWASLTALRWLHARYSLGTQRGEL